MQDVRARPEVMANIARCSGGKILDPKDEAFAQVRGLFGHTPPVTAELRRTPIWDRSWILASIIALLTCEWILRRLRGLA
jgi:hypothetical protein